MDWLRQGIYTMPQVAALARLNMRTLRRWIDTAGGKTAPVPVADEEWGLLSYLDLMQAMAVAAIRRERKVSLQRIRGAVAEAERLDVSYPFARRGTIFLLPGDTIALQVQGPDGGLIDVGLKRAKHYLMVPVVRPYLQDMSFNEEGLPYEWRPSSLNASAVVVTPMRRWGAPVVDPGGYTVETLVNAFESEGNDYEKAARICGAHVDDVRLAVKWDWELSGIAA